VALLYIPSDENKTENVDKCSSVAGHGSLLWLYSILHSMRIRQKTLGNAMVLRGSLFWLHCILHPMRIRQRKFGNAMVLRGSLLWLYCILQHPMRILE
jgi:hypothetical protein